jgi:hypothetical protein
MTCKIFRHDSVIIDVQLDTGLANLANFLGLVFGLCITNLDNRR